MSLKKTTMGHLYTLHGLDYPSVTTVINAMLPMPDEVKKWKREFTHPHFRSPDEYYAYTSVRGTLIHHRILNAVSPVPLPTNHIPPISQWWRHRDIILRDVDACVDAWNAHPLRTHLRPPFTVEKAFYHHREKYAGTPDLISKIHDDLSVLDLKTSRRPYEKHFIQIGGYCELIEANISGLEAIRRGFLVYVRPDSDLEIVELERSELRENAEIFMGLLRDFYENSNVLKRYGIAPRSKI